MLVYVVAAIGWTIACVILWLLRKKTPAEQQLQQVSRDYARARSGHRAQLDSIRIVVQAFEKADDFSDTAVIALVKTLRDRTTERG